MEVPDALALDRLWDLHCQGQADPTPFLPNTKKPLCCMKIPTMLCDHVPDRIQLGWRWPLPEQIQPQNQSTIWHILFRG